MATTNPTVGNPTARRIGTLIAAVIGAYLLYLAAHPESSAGTGLRRRRQRPRGPGWPVGRRTRAEAAARLEPAVSRRG